MDSRHPLLSADFFTHLGRQDMVLYTAYITIFFLLSWIWLRKWAPAISLAIKVLQMDIIGKASQ